MATMTLSRPLVSISDYLHKKLTQRCAERLVLYGTSYGGWLAVAEGVSPSDVVISAGAGEDLSFDVALADKFGCKIHIMDPTPRALDHFNQTKAALKRGEASPINASDTEFYPCRPSIFECLSFHAVGLWDHAATMRFYAPVDEKHVSHSIGNLHGTHAGFNAQCVRLADFIKQIRVAAPKMIKMDIEGAEYRVIRDMIRTRIKTDWLMVEFHAGNSWIEKHLRPKILYHVWLLRRSGYKLVSRRGWDYVFQR